MTQTGVVFELDTFSTRNMYACYPSYWKREVRTSTKLMA